MEEVLSVGQEVTVKIVEVDNEKKRIGLSIRDVHIEEERAEYSAYLEQQSPEDTDVTIGDLFKENQKIVTPEIVTPEKEG